jgi:hypothetical protein
VITAADIARDAFAVMERSSLGLAAWVSRSEALWELRNWRGPKGYSGDNLRLGDYYVRELERIGTEHRQVVRYEVVGTGRIEQMSRSRFERQAKPA